MKARILGAGAWGAGFESVADLATGRSVLSPDPEHGRKIPRPALLPGRELRRAPDFIRLAIEVADQAVRRSGQDVADVRAVFTSGIGDSDITDYMCRTLAGPDRLLSPTRFHNSVHNAAAGCWSIATGSMQATSFVTAGPSSVALGLLEALVQVVADDSPVLFVSSDVPVPGPLAGVHGNGGLFGGALLLGPMSAPAADSVTGHAAASSMGPVLSLRLVEGTPADAGVLNPSARLLPLLRALADGTALFERFGAGTGILLELRLEPASRLESMSA